MRLSLEDTELEELEELEENPTNQKNCTSLVLTEQGLRHPNHVGVQRSGAFGEPTRRRLDHVVFCPQTRAERQGNG